MKQDGLIHGQSVAIYSNKLPLSHDILERLDTLGVSEKNKMALELPEQTICSSVRYVTLFQVVQLLSSVRYLSERQYKVYQIEALLRDVAFKKSRKFIDVFNIFDRFDFQSFVCNY